MTTVRKYEWLLTEYTCAIEPEITNIAQMYILNVNKERFFRSGAKTFNDFKTSSDGHIIFKCILQMFFKFGQELISRLKTLNNKSKPDEQIEEPVIEIFIEGVMKNNSQTNDNNSNSSDSSINVKDIEYTDYTYFIFVKNIPN